MEQFPSNTKFNVKGVGVVILGCVASAVMKKHDS